MLKYIIAFALCLFSTEMRAQIEIKGILISKSSNSKIEGGYVLLKQGEKVLYTTYSDKDGNFIFSNIPKGTYIVVMMCLGYQVIQEERELTENTFLRFEMNEDSIELPELSVKLDSSTIITRTATGERFYLSSHARKQSNPFVALQEIPALVSDVNTSSLTLPNGVVPLVLVNGNTVNTGINPINPADIESVEVINVVSSRYLQEGVNAIVDIRLRKTERKYTWFEAATRHDMPLCNGFGVGYFEFGNQKFSIYGRSSLRYTFHDDMESTVFRSNTTFEQWYKQNGRNDSREWLGELLLKYQPNEKDYFAAQAYYSTNTSKDAQDALGEYSADATRAYQYDSEAKNATKILTVGLYHKHLFKKGEEIETHLYYNSNPNDYNKDWKEFYDELLFDGGMMYKNKRTAGNISVDYSKRFSNNHTMVLGTNTALQSNVIDNIRLESVFRHKNLRQYLYAGYSGMFISKFRYSVSLGMEYIRSKADEYVYNYMRPKASANLVWLVNGGMSSVAASYTLTNTAPSVANLNPNNISADSLVVEVGNPYLKPQMMHFMSVRYTYYKDGLYVVPEVYYKVINDMIEEHGFTKNAIYYSTFDNLGHFSQASAGVTLNKRLKKGNVYGNVGWYANYYEHSKAKNMLYASLGFNYKLGKLSLYGRLNYNSRDCSKNTTTYYFKPATSELQANYNFTPDFYVGVCLQHFTGEFRSKVVTTDGAFHSTAYKHYKDKSLRPWFIARYTFRKNTDKKIKIDKVLENTESGISITR